MKLSAPRLRVLLDAGDAGAIEYDLQTDNRDLVAWDVTRVRKDWPADVATAPFLWMTFLAWSALRREDQAGAGKLDDFLDRCLAVAQVGDGGPDGAGVDPTQPDHVSG